MTHNRESFDVVVIGMGPSGATLAHLLGICGLSVLVLEREAAVHALPRAVHFDDEIMRVFQAIALGEPVAKQTLVNPGMRFVDSSGKLLLDWSRPQDFGPNGWHPSYRFHQPDLENLLGKAISRYPNVQVRRRCEAFLISEQGNTVIVRYEEMSTGRLVEVEAAHAVGCDGARSLVRRFIGSEMQDCGFHERWLVVDVLLQVPKPELGSYSVQHCHPERSITYTRQPGNRRRWEIRLLAGEFEHSPPQPDQIWPLLARWITPEDAEFERFAIYTFHSLIAKRWRNGRLWIAGDAAHQTPPFLGQGMCAGIRDVANLAWKLVLEVQGRADEAILESYETERVPNVSTYIETAIRLGGLVNSSDPQAALQMARPTEEGVFRMESLASRLGPGIGSGLHCGTLFPQPRLRDGRLMDDCIGYAPVLVTELQVLENVDVQLGLQVLTSSDAPDIRSALTELGVCAVLLRPDRYILATARDEGELRKILSGPVLRAMLDVFPAKSEIHA